MISERTKSALAARKAPGLPLGNQTSLRPADREGAARAGVAWSKKAAAHAAMVLPAIQETQAAGMSLRATARDLAKRGFTTVQGGQWTASQVSAVLRRANADPVKEIALCNDNWHGRTSWIVSQEVV